MPKKAKTSSDRKKVPKAVRRFRSLSGQPMDADVEREALFKLLDLKSPGRPYSSQLKDPIVRASKLELMLRGSPEDQERVGRDEDMRIVIEQFQKLFLLLDHFGIPEGSRLRWFYLAFRLARQHVPGMKVVTGSETEARPKSQMEGNSAGLGLDNCGGRAGAPARARDF